MELCMNEVVLAGKLSRDPVLLPDGTTHFLLQAGPKGNPPVHCFGEGASLDNLRKYCGAGDEISLEGQIEHRLFSGDDRAQMLIRVRFISYGRKGRTLRPSSHLG